MRQAILCCIPRNLRLLDEISHATAFGKGTASDSLGSHRRNEALQPAKDPWLRAHLRNSIARTGRAEAKPGPRSRAPASMSASELQRDCIWACACDPLLASSSPETGRQGVRSCCEGRRLHGLPLPCTASELKAWHRLRARINLLMRAQTARRRRFNTALVLGQFRASVADTLALSQPRDCTARHDPVRVAR